LPAAGNLLIVTVPAAEPFSGEELRALGRWIAAGNTLLVLAALADSPEWASASGAGATADVSLLTGLTLEPAPIRASQDLPWRRSTLIPTRPEGYFEGVEQAVALSDRPAGAWRLRLPHESFVLALGRQRETGEEALWVGAQGRGRIIVSAFASLFSDRALGLSGNARLLANLVGGAVGDRGAVIFDDLHQGLSDIYDPARFYRDPRLHQTLAVVAAVWLAWVLAGAPARLRAARWAPEPRGQAELVAVSGRMLARVLPPAVAARGLIDHFLGRVQERLGTHVPWEALERHPGLALSDIRQLRAWHEASLREPPERRIVLARLHNLIQRIEGKLRS
jgi:hypothetical protein